MKGTLLSALALALGLSFGASARADVPMTGTADATTTAQDAAAPEGATIFSKKCAVCHGPDGTVAVPGKKLGAPDKLGAKSSTMEIDKIILVVTKGEGKMKGFEGKLTPEEIKAVAEFAKTLPKE
jgi:cytochrome c6